VLQRDCEKSLKLLESVPSYVAAVVTRRSSIKMICSGTIQFLEVD